MRVLRRTLSTCLTILLLAFMLAAADSAQAQTDAAVSLYGAFTGTTTSNGESQSPSNAAGGLFELRHIANPILGFEATCSFNHADQTFQALVGVACPRPPAPCQAPMQAVSANAHEITADWVPSLKLRHVRPFGVLGAGLLLDVPSSGQSNAQTSTKAVFVYGAGLDWGLLPHLGLRVQYRGNLYQPPDVSQEFGSAGSFTHTAEPMIGLYFRL